jgi:hypothetical protein
VALSLVVWLNVAWVVPAPRVPLGAPFVRTGGVVSIPCATLNEYSHGDGENGDNGERIRNLRVWNERGYDTWRQEKRDVAGEK